MADPPELGEPVRTFDARPARRRALTWLAGAAAAVVVLVPLAVAAFLTGHAPLGAPLTVIAMACAATAGWVAGRENVWRPAQVVHLFTGGLVVAPPPPGDAREHADKRVFAWDDLVSVTVSGIRARDAPPEAAATRWRFTVVAWDGRVLRFGDDLPDVRALGETVAAEVTRRAVPRHLAAVKAGEAVRLGPYTVDLDGVEKEGQRLAWRAVREVEIDGGLVTVRAYAPFPDLTALAGHVPDALAFTVLCDQTKEMVGAS